MWFDERLIFNRNDVVNQDRELYSVTPLRFSNMLHVVRNSPTSANRDDHVAAAHKPLKPVLQAHVPMRSRAAALKIEKKNRGCRMTTGIDLGNSPQNIAGSQNVFHGAVPPGGFKYAERIASKPIAWSRLL